MRVRHGGAFGLPRVFLAALIASLATISGAIPGFVVHSRFLQSSNRIPYADARRVFSAIPATEVPVELRTLTDQQRAAQWPAWLERHDRGIRERLRQGDEDTVMLWMALGTAFTRQPRITDVMAASPDDGAALVNAVRARARDFIGALASGASDDRSAFARQLLAARGVRVDDEAARRAAEQFVIQRLAALLKEQRELAAQLRTARQTADPAAEMAARSTLFRERGLSLDTSLPPNLAIRDALEAVAAKRLMPSGGVASVAVIGPGLDFADKDTGFDFYPLQTVQPFAVYEALLSTGLASRDRVSLFTLDLSPRVNQHLEAARARAARGDTYRLTLPIDRRSWTAAFLQFWKSFGERLGGAGTPPAAAAADLQVRGVLVDSSIVSRITPLDVNIVIDRSASAQFDLVVATNVFVYYSVFEQALALANVEAMLRPGGLLLTNTPLPDLPDAAMRRVGTSATVYSDRPGDGDQIVWYRRTPR